MQAPGAAEPVEAVEPLDVREERSRSWRRRARPSERALVALVALATPVLLSGSSVEATDATRAPLPLLDPSNPVTVAAAGRLPRDRFAPPSLSGQCTASESRVAADLADESFPPGAAAAATAVAATPASATSRFAPLPSLPPRAPAPPPELRIVTEGEIRRGQTLARALGAEGIPAQVVHVIAREMRPVFDFRHSRAGDRFRLVQDPDGSIVSFRYRTAPTVSFRLRRSGDGFRASRVEEELVPRVERMAGIVSSTLYEAVVALGERSSLASEFEGIFAWDLDFARGTRPGDEFELVYERLYRADQSGDWIYVRPGRILAARYESHVRGRLEAFYFEHEAGRGSYYRRDGSAVEREFLASPLQSSRMTSSYTSARRHPILKITRPHWGIDYAAPSGTPTYAVADGEVIYRGWMGGFGKLVKVRHANGYVSYYAHLSRFANGVAVGTRVSQREVIGYVGKTGLATGPHVCFRVKRDGRWVNPLELESPPGEPVPPAVRPQFESVRDLLLAQLDGAALAAVDEAL